MIYLYIILSAAVLSLFLSPVTIKISKRLDVFSNPKKGEPQGKPCLGGLATYAAFITSSGIACFLSYACDSKASGIFIASFFIILAGVLDDIRELKPVAKIAAESLAIIVVLFFGVHTRIWFLPPWLNILISFIWILFITNAFNLLDIADGLTAGMALIIGLTLFVISLVNGNVFSCILLAALIGANLGFLKYNYPPARLYMGDTGSLFCGFLLGVIAINISYAPLEKPFALITPLLIMSLPVYDTLFLIIMRLYKRKPIFSKTNDHFTLRLITMGHSVRGSLWIMYLFTIFLAASSLLVVFASPETGIVTLAIVILVFIFMGKKVGMVKVDD